MPFQSASRAVHRPGRIPIRPPEDDPQHPRLPASVAAAIHPFTMVEDDQPLPPGAIGDLRGQTPPVTLRLRGGFTQGMQQPGDASGPSRSGGSRDMGHVGAWYVPWRTRRWLDSPGRRRLDARTRRFPGVIKHPKHRMPHRSGRLLPVGIGVGTLSLVGLAITLRPATPTPPPLAVTTTTATPQPDRSTPNAPPAAEADLARKILRLVRGAGLGADKVSVSVRACDDGDGPGREIVSIDSRRPFKPASNMKVISTGAALHELGADFQFQTRVVFDGDAYVLIGDGDPALGDPHFFDVLRYRDRDGEERSLDEERLLEFWADAIAGHHAEEGGGGIRLLVDDSIFESRGWHDGWNPDDRLRGFAAEVGGINFHRNTWHFRPDPSGGGRPDWSDMRPRSEALLSRSNNKSTRAGKGKDSTAWIQRSPEANDFTFRGAVAGTYRPTNPALELTMHDPPMALGNLLADRVRRRGVEVVEVVRGTARSPESAITIGPRIKSPIDRLVEHCNEESQNLYAESLLKRTIHARNGGTAKWEDADETIEEIARERLGAGADELLVDVKIDDGSGLSHGNRLNASFVTAWLDSMQADPEFGELFVESLSEGGVPGDGTLGKRFKGFPGGYRAEAKSGYISGVSALSGYVTGPDGRRWSFSVLCNGVAGKVRSAMTLQERIAREIANHGKST
ncbi:MAG: D-alanyl-D-alanine carboxypeptidase/D-alanyl-D-alanine-endopeptidase [Phycisphaerae bacterium]|nr:D-alanyl-D-alanine carboxypeptidase/D-alanyl-D-alanine-endopeptidase [Phycisphaerae bacterium]